jgi:vacuolar-type H+-ATPase subunit I/STV1
LLFWAIGFGVMHIFYGSMMYFRYESSKTKSETLTR